MTYTNVKLNLTDHNKTQIMNAVNRGNGVTMQLSPSEQRQGDVSLSLTNAQINAVAKAIISGKGVRLSLSTAQTKHMKKQGGFLPLILAGLGALGSIAGGAAGIAKAVDSKAADKKKQREIERHNKAMESKQRMYVKAGQGLYQRKSGGGLYLTKQ